MGQCLQMEPAQYANVVGGPKGISFLCSSMTLIALQSHGMHHCQTGQEENVHI